jgi:endonuclease-3
MSKRLKLGTLATSKTLRSGRIIANVDSSEETSPYFDSEKKLTTKTCTRKRLPIKIKHETTEDEENIKNIDVTSTVKNENAEKLTDAQNVKIGKYVFENEVAEQSIDSKIIKKEEQWMPLNWEIILENIKEMRKHETAPVDEMGCHKCADPNASPSLSRYQSLIALMLSSQTKDQVTHAAMQRLNTFGCKPDTLATISDDVLGKLIYPVGFWKVYTYIYFLDICKILYINISYKIYISVFREKWNI